ncbi:MAG: hypothetical protein WAW39_24280 [Prosthecobacter sp.]|uniref:hypothetical protein n=1 Tax=Prosthecobacter sp. TaxID=1965333 RepID=UPI003BAF81C8
MQPRSRFALGWLCALILLAGLQSTKAFITDCAKPTMLGEIKFKDATLEEAVTYVKRAVKNLHAFGDENLNVIILGASEEQKKKKISLEVREISLRSALDQIAHAVGLKVRVDAHAVVLTSAALSDELSTRTYRVPPDFISTGSASK